jgi:hypothetical protein
MAREEFERVRAIFTICKVVLPTYNTTRNLREHLKERIGLTVAEQESPLGNPCFGLKMKEIITQASFSFELNNYQWFKLIEFLT